ncbi:hypothetical protein B0H63DRAFT_445363 [Podospora didyma]|uniref:Ankyrin n=1 Tax=Podospora didyma TaxID=330526 RepID=A0AAE0NX99_9PEZI|nr:hypothetical protein B0H63DRAFT_445363 [Podospora didyma]
MVRVLLQAGADPFQPTLDTGETPVGYALLRSLGGKVCDRQIAEMMPISAQLEEDGFTELHRVLMGILPLGLASALANPFIKAQSSTKTTSDRLTPLHLAAMTCTGEEISLLLSAGAHLDLEARTRSGVVPQYLACLGGREDTAKALLAAGAFVHASRNPESHWNLIHATTMAKKFSGSLGSSGLRSQLLYFS